MNFTAEAVAATAPSDSLSKPAAAPLVGAPSRGPAAAFVSASHPGKP